MNFLRHALEAVQWGFLGYFILLNAIYLGLAFIAMYRLRRYMGGVAAAERVYSHLQMPVSLVVPAYNEAGDDRDVGARRCCSCATSTSR